MQEPEVREPDANKPDDDPVQGRLLKAALDCFLADDYARVTTRLSAERANANVSMVRYYFGSNEGLYEEMERPMDAAFLDRLAAFNGHLFSAGLASTTTPS
jgi:AcrR family transcriptional regulator